MIRSLYVLLWLIPVTIFFGMLAIVISIFDRSGNISHLCGRLWAKWILWTSGVCIDIRGLENISPDQSYIFAANHQSWYDILALLGYLPIQFRFLAKKELFRIPIFGWAMYSVGYIPIDRSSPKEALKSVKRAAVKVTEGTSIIIFPEGTRSINGEVKSFRTGGFALAIQSGKPIIPVSINGGHKVLPRNSLKVRSGKIMIALCRPIDSSPYSMRQKSELMERVRNAVLENFDRIRCEI